MFEFEQRAGESPLAETIWRTRSEADTPGQFTSVAVSHWELVFTRAQGVTRLVLRGPETRATPAPVPTQAEFWGVRFTLGSFLPHFPTAQRVDGALVLPDASQSRFWLNGSAWEYPDFEHTDVFLERLERAGLLTRDPIVQQVMQQHSEGLALHQTLSERSLSERTVQRRFIQATGLSHQTLRRIEQGRSAQALLAGGHSIADTVFLAGYADQPHLTRALKTLTGQTPAQLVRHARGQAG